MYNYNDPSKQQQPPPQAMKQFTPVAQMINQQIQVFPQQNNNQQISNLSFGVPQHQSKPEQGMNNAGRMLNFQPIQNLNNQQQQNQLKIPQCEIRPGFGFQQQQINAQKCQTIQVKQFTKNDEMAQNEYMTCTYEGHENKQVLCFCLVRVCEKKGLCCFLCTKQFHLAHSDQLLDFQMYKEQRVSILNNFENTKKTFQKLEIQSKNVQDLIFNIQPIVHKPISEQTATEIKYQIIQLLQIEDLNVLIGKNFGTSEDFLKNIDVLLKETKSYNSIIQNLNKNDNLCKSPTFISSNPQIITPNPIIYPIKPQTGPLKQQPQFQQFQKQDFSNQNQKMKTEPIQNYFIQTPANNQAILFQDKKNIQVLDNDSELKRVEHSNLELFQENTKLKNDYKEQKINYEKKLEEAQLKSENLQITIDQLMQQQQKNEQSEQEIQQLKTQLANAQSRLDQQKQQLFEQKFINQKLLEGIQVNYEKNLEEAQLKSENLQITIDQLMQQQQKNEQSEQEIQQLKTQLANAQSRLDQQKQQLFEQKFINQKLLEGIQVNYEKKLEEAQLKSENLQIIIDQLMQQQQKNEQSEQEIQQLKTQLANAQSRLDQQKQQLFEQKFINQKLLEGIQGQKIKQSGNTLIQNLDQQQRLLQEAQIAFQQEVEKEKKIQSRINALQEKSGKIQCLFVTDFPKNERSHQQSIINSVINCFQSIKQKTGRDSFWGAITYAGKILNSQQSFSPDPQAVEQFLKDQQNINSVEFEDKPEDLKLALQKAAQMDWNQKFKLAIIISASACHGKIYQHPSKFTNFFFFQRNYDVRPNDTIEDAIVDLINKNIVLLGFSYTEETVIMYSKIQKIYKNLKRPDLFFMLKIQNMNQKEEIIKNVNGMVEHLIGTKISTTKTRINQIKRLTFFEDAIRDMKFIKQRIYQVQKASLEQTQFEEETKEIFQDGALQALYRKGDIPIFESQVDTVEFKCSVYMVAFKHQAFDKKRKNIYDINLDDLTSGKKSEVWNCTKTKDPFASGMMKNVYIIKNKTTHELYAGKVPIDGGPYKSLEEAMLDSKSHLISKALMEEFMKKVQRTKIHQEYPHVSYTDFFILEEICGQQKTYCFAEKFMDGEFKKYNNNDGYILEEDTLLNRLAQTFSYYTYSESEGSYIVNDVQGFGHQFTDPAINTLQGKFDETDNGEEGMAKFMTTLKQKQFICNQLLNEIGIEFE